MPGEEALEVLGDHLLERHEAAARRGSWIQRGSEGGTLTRAKRTSALRRAAHRDRQREREVRDERERVRRVEPERGQDREDAARRSSAPSMAALDVGEVAAAPRARRRAGRAPAAPARAAARAVAHSSGRTAAPIAASCSAGVRPSGESAGPRRSRAGASGRPTRFMKNSSRLPPKSVLNGPRMTRTHIRS